MQDVDFLLLGMFSIPDTDNNCFFWEFIRRQERRKVRRFFYGPLLLKFNLP